MSCFHPIKAFQPQGGGQIVFTERAGGVPLSIPCGQCIGCRLERSRQWAMRCVHEASQHEDNCFITLTYSPEKLPPDGSLIKSDFQKFMKRLRKSVKKKSDIIIAENTAIEITVPIIMQYCLDITLMTGFIYSTLHRVSLYTRLRLLKKSGKMDLSQSDQLHLNLLDMLHVTA